MKAMILAAGLGTRLRPWTLSHPKALVPVGGVPMLERVIGRLRSQGFDDVVINIHHFGDQIIDFVNTREEDSVKIRFSDERDGLLDTGGGLLRASRILMAEDDAPFIIHNVDILSNADLSRLYAEHLESGDDVTLLVSERHSTRKLIIDADRKLRGWHNLTDDQFRPSGLTPSEDSSEVAFSGIYIIGKRGVEALEEYASARGLEAFPIMDFFLDECQKIRIGTYQDPDCPLELIDIGKPATLEQAEKLLNE